MKKVIPKRTEYYCDLCGDKIKIKPEWGCNDFYKFKKLNLVKHFDKHCNYIPKKKFMCNMYMCNNCYKKLESILSKGGF